MAKKQYKTLYAPAHLSNLNELSTNELLEMGHKPVAISIQAIKANGSKEVNKKPIPKSVGFATDGRLLYARQTFEAATRIRPLHISILKDDGIEELRKFVEENFSEFEFTVKTLETRSKNTDMHCLWRRKRVSNGSNLKALVLDEVDAKPFQKIDYKKLVEAADDMFDDACVYETSRIEYVNPQCVRA